MNILITKQTFSHMNTLAPTQCQIIFPYLCLYSSAENSLDCLGGVLTVFTKLFVAIAFG